MNKLTQYLSLFIINILSVSVVSADLVDGKSFILYLKGSDHENINSISGFYDGYISGVADSTSHSDWCPPEGFKRSQLLRIINEFYEKNTSLTKDTTLPAKALILHALQDTYPCK